MPWKYAMKLCSCVRIFLTNLRQKCVWIRNFSKVRIQASSYNIIYTPCLFFFFNSYLSIWNMSKFCKDWKSQLVMICWVSKPCCLLLLYKMFCFCQFLTFILHISNLLWIILGIGFDHGLEQFNVKFLVFL